MWKSLCAVTLVSLIGLATTAQAQPGKGKGGEGDYKKLEAQLSKLAEQVADLAKAVSKLQGKGGPTKVEEKGKEDWKKKFEGKDKDWDKKKEEFKKKFEGKGKGFGPGGFGPWGKFGEGKKPGEFKKPGGATTEELLQQILKELKAIHAEKSPGKGPGGFGGGFGPGGFKASDFKKPEGDKKPDFKKFGEEFKKPEFKKFGEEFKKPGGDFFFKQSGEKSKEASGTDQVLRQILEELKAIQKEKGGKK